MASETAHSSNSSLFTCITCRVAFRDASIQRAHYKTDWHRYNLKRKVAELPPVSAETFQEKVLAQRDAASASSQSKHEICEVCKKHFTSRNSYENHIQSKKHRDAVIAQEKKKEMLEETGDGKSDENSAKIDTKDDSLPEEHIDTDSECEPEPLDAAECLFCPHESSDMEQNLSHMSKAHGFFIPELEYLADLKGLIEYLCEKVGVGYMCLYCNERGKTFYSVESVQQHMTDKCHCKIYFEGDSTLEYAEYYDYTKSYPDHKEAGKEEGEDAELVGDKPQEPLPLPDANVEVNDDLELVLPSGSKLGHRALKQYYRQRLPTQDQRKSAMIGRLMAQYRALGWRGYGGGEGGELRQRDEAWGRRMRKARDLKLSVKANKFQPHLRPQVVF